ncbi:MAG: VOC family protein [Opitutales bacterium]
MNPHRGLLHHQIITVRNVARSSPFYGAMLRYLGYELAGSQSGPDHAYEDWKPWRLDTPHEISIAQGDPALAAVPHQRGAVGHHHHIAFCAEDRADVDRFYAEVLAPLARQGLGTIEDPPVDCPEYGEGYYATFFLDPDGLKYEFVFNPNYLRAKAARPAAPAASSPPLLPLYRDQRKVDAQHLNLLAVFHFVIAGLAVLGLGFLFLHYSLMHHFFDNPAIWKNAKGGPPPAEFFALFKWFYVLFGGMFVVSGLLNLLSGLFIRRRRFRLFSMIVGGLDCLQMPFGTVLWVFTLIVLARDSVQEVYSARSVPNQ